MKKDITNPLKWFIDWWAHLDSKWQVGIPISFLIISGLMLFAGQVFILGWALGIVLLLIGGKKKSDLF